jgi:hypothetical protein
VEARGPLDLVQELVAVVRVADRARGERLDLVDAGGPAEGGEHGGGMERELDTVGAEHAPVRALLTHPGADPDGLANLVDEAPPGRVGLVAEDHETPGVRPHVDDRNPLHDWG